MINTRRWPNAVLALFALALAGAFPARAGAQDDAPWAAEPSPGRLPPLGRAPDQTGPSSNSDAKRAREPGSSDASPQGDGALDLPLQELDLGVPGQRAKVLDQLYGDLGRAQDAKDAVPITEVIEQIWRLSGSDTIDLLLARADMFVKEADFAMAARVLDSVVELAPEDAEGWHQRAMVSFMQDDYQQALADLDRALGIDPQHYKALHGLGVVLIELGDKKSALEAFRKALKVNPFLDSARKRLEELSREVEGQDI